MLPNIYMLPNIVKRPLQAAYRKVVQFNLALRKHEYQYVFILAHMRSGSTLLSHILANHPEFAGAGETHISYRSSTDLPQLVLITCQRLRTLQLDARYVVDQINHGAYLTDEILLSPLVHKCVILIRSPEKALQSMISLYGWKESIALDSYVNRLSELANYGSILKERAFLIEYDDLVEQTEPTLQALTDFFDVEPPFRPEYRPHLATVRFGDPSSNITTGRVVRTPPHPINISAEALEQASEAYQKCRAELLRSRVRSRCDSNTNPSVESPMMV